MINDVAKQIAHQLGDMVNDDQIAPTDVAIGATRGVIAFWMGCMQEGARVEGLNVLRQGVNEEIDNLIRGVANGMVPA